MSLPPEDSIMPAVLPPPTPMRVLPTRERTPRRAFTRDEIKQEAAATKAPTSISLIIGLLAALVLVALPIPLLFDGTVTMAPRAGLLALIVIPPVVFMAVIQSRYGNSGQ